ncbi:MAG TPA: flagellar hook basal-body protein [Candidatus Aquilonibacter sp.]|nr:flagellar hook basal-body protein [Candidatus Aquilonibacter sp.]
MDSGYYAACSGLVARMQALDVTANNLANVSTAGYKAEDEFYGALNASMAAQSVPQSQLNQAINRFGILGGDYLNMHEGSLDPTGNPLDVALQGSGLFVVQTPAGLRYTRAGNFHLNPHGQLVSSQGDLVMGQGGPIQLPGIGKIGPITLPQGTIGISADGTVSVNGSMAGHLVIADTDPGTQLAPEGNLYFTAPDGSVKTAANTTVQQGALEASNMNPIDGAIDLVSIQRNAQLMMRAVSIFNDDFNRTAAEQIGRV